MHSLSDAVKCESPSFLGCFLIDFTLFEVLLDRVFYVRILLAGLLASLLLLPPLVLAN
jgi:hypothetical protein